MLGVVARLIYHADRTLTLATAFAPAIALAGAGLMATDRVKDAWLAILCAGALWAFHTWSMRRALRHTPRLECVPVRAEREGQAPWSMLVGFVLPIGLLGVAVEVSVWLGVIAFVLAVEIVLHKGDVLTGLNPLLWLSGWEVYRVETPEGRMYRLLTRDYSVAAAAPRRVGLVSRRVFIDKTVPRTNDLSTVLNRPAATGRAPS